MACKCVPIASPALKRVNTLGSRPDAITVCAPLLAARLAASILVSMPPLPMSLPAPPAIFSSSKFPAVSKVINFASLSLRGSAEYKPCWSVKITKASASIKFATSAPSVSLSPKRISSVTTVSFSLMIGITFKSSKVLSVERAFK